jgi:hypothetical protein
MVPKIECPVEGMDECPRRRSTNLAVPTEGGEWKRVALIILCGILTGASGFGIGYVVSHEHRLTALESEKKSLKEAVDKEDASIRAEFRSAVDRMEAGQAEIRADIKKLLERR